MGETLDTPRAELLLSLAQAAFVRAAGVPFESTTVTYVTTGTTRDRLLLPYAEVTAVSALRINGVAAVDYTLAGSVLYRAAGFGNGNLVPPDVVEVDLTYGYASVPDVVKAAVLDTAAQAYNNPTSSVVQESIDDYSARYTAGAGGVRLTPMAEELARSYRGAVFA